MEGGGAGPVGKMGQEPKQAERIEKWRFKK